MRYLFILGRNRELSIAEIASYLEARQIKVDNFWISENSLLIDSEEINLSLVEELGGTIALGKVFEFGSLADIEKYLSQKEIYFGEEIKFTYSFLDYTKEEGEEILDLIKKKFKQERLKALYREVRGVVKTQEGEKVAGTPSKLKTDLTYFLFQNNQEYSFGILQGVSDVKESEKRDMNKPIRRESQAISPRLSKILINLSQVKEGQVLLDPFCGVGGIVQEALLQGINCIGVDSDKAAIESAKQNLKWLKEKYHLKSDFQLINQDSGRVRLQMFNGIATEPNLGELLKRRVTEKEAEEMAKKFENLIIFVMANLKKYLEENGSIALTSPLVLIGKKRVGCNIGKILEKAGLRMKTLKLGSKEITFPIKEFRENQLVGREIYVLTI